MHMQSLIIFNDFFNTEDDSIIEVGNFVCNLNQLRNNKNNKTKTILRKESTLTLMLLNISNLIYNYKAFLQIKMRKIQYLYLYLS